MTNDQYFLIAYGIKSVTVHGLMGSREEKYHAKAQRRKEKTRQNDGGQNDFLVDAVDPWAKFLVSRRR